MPSDPQDPAVVVTEADRELFLALQLYSASSAVDVARGMADRSRNMQKIAAFRLSTQSAMQARETLESIVTWGDQTFGPCSQERAIERAGEEWSEMEEDGADVPIEAADVIICLLRIPGILDAINRKMAINRGRTWDVRPDGTGYHVKSATLSNIGGSNDG